MAGALEAARKAARKAQESTYEGKADVIEHKKVKNSKSNLTSYEDVVVLEGQPCRLSFSKITTVAQGETAAKAEQTTKLFISPDIRIKPGSKIIVTQDGITTGYTYSGVPAVYSTHQEYMLELFKEWA